MRERRFKKQRSPRQIFLVICEGETEEAYIEILKRHYRLPIIIKTKVSGNYINNRLVSQYIKDVGIESGDDYRIFYIYDADVKNVVDKLNALPGDVILTNPCIELWFMLHVMNFNSEQRSESVVKALMASHPAWRTYGKGRISSEQNDMLIANRHIAIARSQALSWPGNPSSNMGLLIGILEKSKNR